MVYCRPPKVGPANVRRRRSFGASSYPCCSTEDVAMRTSLDFTPLYRSGIGFDRVFDLLENAGRAATVDSWPPYDIVRAGEDAWRITMAVAGFSQAELTITHEPNLLVVSGARAGEETGEYLYRGIAARAFERRFELAEHV